MFKKGDKVRVIERGLDSYGQVGTIVEIEDDWFYPIEIVFDNGYMYEDELFAEFQIELVKEDNSDSEIISDIETLIFKLKNRPSEESKIAIMKLKEAKMWINEGLVKE